ncbi:MAG: alpha,alpha-trehalose-phosphate synthase (UDP-forming) [Gammaproteobacteria bacterium]|nr:alpha,alpha-trehalose-phosphate synthase (UDP-forming) [Gammaproteobacteria bacterium]
MSRLVAVSNRVAVPERGQSAGGLAVGVLDALRKHGGVWFGWSGEITDTEPSDPTVSKRGRVSFATIDLARRDYERYYNGFCNNILWPLFHFQLGFFDYHRSQYDAYRRVNRLFARKLKRLLEPDDMIWVHDYHLITLAQELRHAGAEQPIGFFLHVPFPGPEVLHALPVYLELLEALASFDVVGFQTSTDLDAFHRCIERDLDAQIYADGACYARGRLFRADYFPIGIDVEAVSKLAERASASKTVARMVSSLRGRQLLIGVDRLDYSKGLPQRFQSFKRLLADYPDTRGKVVYLQIAPPSRTAVRAYDAIRLELEQAAGNINGQFADFDWVPLRYLNRGFARSTLMGFLRIGRVGLVTPLRDGMNLVAKEFVASQDPADPGVLVLSTLAGAARELDAALLVNPYDTYAVAQAVQRALHMELDERRERMSSMLAMLTRNSIEAWRTRFIDALRASPRTGE